MAEESQEVLTSVKHLDGQRDYDISTFYDGVGWTFSTDWWGEAPAVTHWQLLPRHPED